MKESRNPHMSTRPDQIGRRKRRKREGSTFSPLLLLLLFHLCSSDRPIVPILTLIFSFAVVTALDSRYFLRFSNFILQIFSTSSHFTMQSRTSRALPRTNAPSPVRSRSRDRQSGLGFAGPALKIFNGLGTLSSPVWVVLAESLIGGRRRSRPCGIWRLILQRWLMFLEVFKQPLCLRERRQC